MTGSLVALLLPFLIRAPLAGPGGHPQEKREKLQLTVFAAASLNEAFRAIAGIFQDSNPGITVGFNFAGSQQLVQELTQGAPADVFASADTKQMDLAIQSGRIDSSSVRTFADNRLAIIAPKSSGGVASFQDLAKPGRKLVLADEAVPAGRYSLQFLDRCSSDSASGRDFKKLVLRNVVSYEENVRAVLSKVVLGEADAGIVYVTDITDEPARQLVTIDIPTACNVVATYPIATVRDSPNGEAAQRFLRCVLSAEGQAVLRRYRFTAGSER